MKNLLKFDLASFLLLLAAFVGNAQIFNIDIVLILCVLILFTQLATKSRNALPKPLVTGFLLTMLVVAAFRSNSVGIPYFDAYYLWAIKAICLMFLVATGNKLTWPMANMIALAILCFALIAVGRVEGGRLVSIFGPNMLYRLFGFLLMFGAILYPMVRRSERLIMFCLAGFGLFGSLLTGSNGALLTIAVVMALATIRFSRKLSLILGVAGFYVLLTVEIFVISSNISFGEFTVFQRLDYVIVTLDSNLRLAGWIDILSRGLSLAGHNHADFWYLWSYGYRYPHNIFVELIGFYGVVGLILSLVVLTAVARAMPRIIQGDVTSMILVVLTTGAMLSGDLSDNVGVIGLACGLLIRNQPKKVAVSYRRFVLPSGHLRKLAFPEGLRSDS